MYNVTFTFNYFTKFEATSKFDGLAKSGVLYVQN